MKLSLILSLTVLAGFGIWIAGTLLAVRKLEEPKFSIVENKKAYQIREYAPYIVAEVQVTGTQQQALNSGFRLLAGYIFGGNTKKESIAMTTPVQDIQTQSESIKMTVPVIDIEKQKDTHIIQFTMPEKYTLETLPKPNNPQVTFREIPTTMRAVLRYTGWATAEKVALRKQMLSDALKKDGYQIVGDMISAQYNPPLSFPYLRRNEILVDIIK